MNMRYKLSFELVSEPRSEFLTNYSEVFVQNFELYAFRCGWIIDSEHGRWGDKLRYLAVFPAFGNQETDLTERFKRVADARKWLRTQFRLAVPKKGKRK
jgi:hypothetical protein